MVQNWLKRDMTNHGMLCPWLRSYHINVYVRSAVINSENTLCWVIIHLWWATTNLSVWAHIACVIAPRNFFSVQLSPSWKMENMYHVIAVTWVDWQHWERQIGRNEKSHRIVIYYISELRLRFLGGGVYILSESALFFLYPDPCKT